MKKPVVIDILFGKETAPVDDLRKLLLMQLCFFTTLNTVSAIISITTKEVSDAERSSVIVGVILLWSCIPFGLRGAYVRNAGMISFFVLYGLLSGAARSVLRIVAAVMVASSCQMEQTAFKGCTAASSAGLSCLLDSSCTRTMIEIWNDNRDVAEYPNSCKAWGVNDCKNAPITQTSMGFNGMKVFYLLIDVFTACMPVYVAFLYFARLEAHRAAQGATPDLQSLNEQLCTATAVEKNRDSMRDPMRDSLAEPLVT
ncbi:hypothetical protein DIPPA_04158 [Diplonema papillatum]|nr:hypothetical protein DIPPA_04158 [Diplonema papillatum]